MKRYLILFVWPILGALLLNSSAPSPYRWHTFYGSTSMMEGAYGIAVAGDGSIYITGQSYSNWLGDLNEPPLHPCPADGPTCIVVLKLDQNGAYQWHTFYGSGGSDRGNGITVDKDGGVYVTSSGSQSWLGDGGAEPLHPFSGGFDEIGILKLDSDGAYLWHTFYGSSLAEHASGIAASADGNIYLAGSGIANWLGDAGQEPIHPYSGGQDIVIMKLDRDGRYQWHTFYGSSNIYGEQASNIAINKSEDVFITGSSWIWHGDDDQKPIHPVSLSFDLFVLKLNSQGAYQWHTFYGSANGEDYASDITASSVGEVYVTGASLASWLGDEGAEPLHPFAEDPEIVILKLDENGAYQWHTFYGSSAEGEDTGRGIAIAGDGSVYVTGRSSGSWQGSEGSEPIHPYAGYRNLFVLKTNSHGVYRWHTFYGEEDTGNDVAVAADGQIFVAGEGEAWLGDNSAEPIHPNSGESDLTVLSLQETGRWFYLPVIRGK